MPGPVIVAYDPFREDRVPVKLGLLVARALDAELLAVAVHGALLVDPSEYREDSTVAMVAVATAALHRLHQDLGITTRVVADPFVARGVHDLARELDAQLIVVGSTTRGPVGRVIPGSTAEGMLRGAPCPVLVAPHGWKAHGLHAIAAGFDATPESRTALAAARTLAASTGARLRIVNAAHDAHAAEVQEAAGAEVEFHAGDAADVLVDVSQHVDLLVCGSRGCGPLRELLLGSVSRRVVDRAHCPVLVLPRGADAGGPPARSASSAAKG